MKIKYSLFLVHSLCAFILLPFQIYQGIPALTKPILAKHTPIFEQPFLQPIIDLDQVINLKNNNIAYLTFDDGPSDDTAGILDILDKYGIKATFFMLEPQMRQHPDIVKRMNEAGHVLGLHSVTHDHRKFYASAASVVAEMEQALHTLESITGESTPFIRTPYGSKPFMKQEYMDAIKAHHFILWDWNVDSLDWQYRDKSFVEETVNQVKLLQVKQQAPVILMHDLKETKKYLPHLLDQLIKMGYDFQPLNKEMKPIQLMGFS